MLMLTRSVEINTPRSEDRASAVAQKHAAEGHQWKLLGIRLQISSRYVMGKRG